MRLYYIDESKGPRYYVRSALGVDGERWNELFGDIHAWRLELQERYGIPLSRELHACDLLAGRGRLARNGDTNERVTLSPNPPMRSGLGVRTRGEGRGTRRSALDSDKWGRWRPLVVVGGADGGPGQRRWGGVGGTVCRGRQSRTGPVRLCGAVG